MQPVLVVSWKTGPTKSNRPTECTHGTCPSGKLKNTSGPAKSNRQTECTHGTCPSGKLKNTSGPSPIGRQSTAQFSPPDDPISVCQLKISGSLQAWRELLCSVFSWNFVIHLQFFLVICFTFHLCSCRRYIIKIWQFFLWKEKWWFLFVCGKHWMSVV